MKLFNIKKIRYSILGVLLLLVLSTSAFANVHLTSFNEFKDIIQNKYIYRDILVPSGGWSALFAKYESSLVNASDSNSFAKILNDLVLEIRDLKFMVFDANGRTLPTHWDNTSELSFNYNTDALPRIVKNFQDVDQFFGRGQVDSVGYLLIRNWLFDNTTSNTSDLLSQAIAEFGDSTDGLIIDLRSNGGGYDVFKDFAQHFLRSDVTFAFHDYFDEDWNIQIQPWIFSADLSKPHYSKPVLLLVGNRTGSAAESFTFLMKYTSNVKSIGDILAGNTGGNPYTISLPNVVKIQIPSLACKFADGVYHVRENRIAPDQYIPFINDGSDNVLIEAFRQLGVTVTDSGSNNSDNIENTEKGGCNIGFGMFLLLFLSLLVPNIKKSKH